MSVSIAVAMAPSFEAIEIELDAHAIISFITTKKEKEKKEYINTIDHVDLFRHQSLYCTS